MFFSKFCCVKCAWVFIQDHNGLYIMMVYLTSLLFNMFALSLLFTNFTTQSQSCQNSRWIISQLINLIDSTLMRGNTLMICFLILLQLARSLSSLDFNHSSNITFMRSYSFCTFSRSSLYWLHFSFTSKNLIEICEVWMEVQSFNLKVTRRFTHMNTTKLFGKMCIRKLTVHDKHFSKTIWTNPPTMNPKHVYKPLPESSAAV